MPHKNALAQLKAYGPLALRLDDWTNRIDDAYPNEPKRKVELERFSEWSESTEAQDMVERLSRDKYAYNREIAAVSGFYLWERWIYLPYTDGQSEEYEHSVKQYLHSLDWTLPILLRLVTDTNSGPAELAVKTARGMDKASDNVRKQYREALLVAGKSRFRNVRLKVVEYLPGLYPDDDQAKHTLDDAAMKFMLGATRDPDIKVRDWACFKLWLEVQHLGDDAEAAFRERLEKEESDSDVHLEALTGLVGLADDQNVTWQICERFEKDDDFGSGWIDAVERSQQVDCLLALIEAHKRILAKYPNDNIIEKIERVFIDWNDDI